MLQADKWQKQMCTLLVETKRYKFISKAQHFSVVYRILDETVTQALKGLI
jgi:hypothetical protein